MQISPNALRPRSNLLFALNLMPRVTRESMFREHREWSRIHADSLFPVARGGREQVPELNDRRKSEPIRLGYVSGDLWGGHPVGRIFSAVLPFHDRERFIVTCYDSTRTRDDLNAKLRACADSWVEVRELDDEALADRVRRDAIDVLVDLSGHTRNNRLLMFARKPASVQVSWLGYLNTTGMRAMDWRVVSDGSELPGAEQFHTERLWSLDCLPWPWVPPEGTSDDFPQDDSGLRREGVTFGSFNAFRKLNADVLTLWAEILKDVENSRLLIFGVPEGACVERTYDHFEAAGIDTGRLSLIRNLDHARYLMAYRDVDIALDPFPYNGGATTCESLWMGVPLITLAGSGGFGRTSACILRQLGFEDLVSETLEDYRCTAVRLAGDVDHPYRQRALFGRRVQALLRESPTQIVRKVEDAFANMHAAACEQGSGEW